MINLRTKMILIILITSLMSGGIVIKSANAASCGSDYYIKITYDYINAGDTIPGEPWTEGSDRGEFTLIVHAYASSGSLITNIADVEHKIYTGNSWNGNNYENTNSYCYFDWGDYFKVTLQERDTFSGSEIVWDSDVFTPSFDGQSNFYDPDFGGDYSDGGVKVTVVV